MGCLGRSLIRKCSALLLSYYNSKGGIIKIVFIIIMGVVCAQELAITSDGTIVLLSPDHTRELYQVESQSTKSPKSNDNQFGFQIVSYYSKWEGVRFRIYGKI